METRRIGVVMNGVTGRMGMNQHLLRSIVPIMADGGVRVSPGLTLMPEPVLCGRNAEKLKELAARAGALAGRGALEWTTDVEAAVRSDACDVVFDASVTQQRGRFVEMAAAAGKAVYCEKPIATGSAEAMRLVEVAERAGIGNGVVCDKLWLPGIRKLRGLIEGGFFGRILSVRGEFGYWVFTGMDADQPPQRPSWNYRAADGGGIVADMFCHWRYVLDHVFGDACGRVTRMAAWAHTDIGERVDEAGKAYAADADDSAYAMFLLGDSVMAQFNSSWCTRVRRDDLLTIQVDGTEGSAVAGLRECWTQLLADTPRPVWNPDIAQPIDFREGWTRVEDGVEYANAFRVQWELFLRHVALGEAFAWTMREGVRGVQLAELALEASARRAWVEVPA